MTSQPIEAAISQRKDILEIIIVAALISAGINLLTTGITTGKKPVTLGGGLLLLSSVGILARNRLSRINRSLIITAAVPYNREENSIHKLPEYEFSQDFVRNLNSAFVEDSNLSNIWKTKPISETNSDQKGNRYTADDLAEELFEYLLLAELSTQLTDYFDGSGVDVKRYSRSDTPKILLENSFINLFSKPLSKRSAFDGEESINVGIHRIEDDDPKDEGELVMAWGPEGQLYDKFELVLPEGCNIERNNDGSIKISSNKLEIEIETRFRGTNALIDRDLLKLALGDYETENIALKELEARINIEMNYFTIIRDISKEYRWIDFFLENLKKKYSLQEYKNRLDLENARITSALLKRREKASKQNMVPKK